jgi:2-dehydropantoate 2-reductase
MKILVFGSGVQGTLFGVRLAQAGHDVTLVARADQAAELRARGARIKNATSGIADSMRLPVIEQVVPETTADLCLVTVRREQIEEALLAVGVATGITRCLVMVNHANGSGPIFAALGRPRVVLGFPGAAGGMESGVVCYIEVSEQPTVIESSAPDVATLVRDAGFHVELVADMDSWLQRHAVFVTAMCGALYQVDCDAVRLAEAPLLVRCFVLAVREGWAALDRLGIAPPPLALRTIFRWVPLPIAVYYWRSLLRSARGELYFARHARHAVGEIAALAADVRTLTSDAMPNLRRLFASIEEARLR